MLRQLIAPLLLVHLALTICVEVEPSLLASASDCEVYKIDQNTISWSAIIHFLGQVQHREDNWFNLLADMEHPRLPYFPFGSDCSSQYGRYSSGGWATINCTQSFEEVPRDYVNAVYILEDSVSPLGFTMKVPVGTSDS